MEENQRKIVDIKQSGKINKNKGETKRQRNARNKT